MKRSNFALRLQPGLMEELRKAAEAEGVALNQLINVAVAEKLSAMRTAEFFKERSQRANRAETVRILERAGANNPPLPGDELPEAWEPISKSSTKPRRKPARSARGKAK